MIDGGKVFGQTATPGTVANVMSALKSSAAPSPAQPATIPPNKLHDAYLWLFAAASEVLKFERDLDKMGTAKKCQAFARSVLMSEGEFAQPSPGAPADLAPSPGLNNPGSTNGPAASSTGMFPSGGPLAAMLGQSAAGSPEGGANDALATA